MGRGGGVALFLCAEGEVGEDGFTGESGAEDGGGPLGIHRAGDAAGCLKKPDFSQSWIFLVDNRDWGVVVCGWSYGEEEEDIAEGEEE